MQPARSIVMLVPYLKANGVYRILDYGAGTLRNSYYLANHGFTVLATDCKIPAPLPEIKKNILWVEKDVLTARILKKVDLVLCNFVLNIAETVCEQETMLSEIDCQLRPGGYLLLETRENRTGTLQPIIHAMSKTELDTLVFRHGLSPIMFLRGRISLTVLYKKNIFN